MAQLEVFGGLVVTGLAGVLKATTGLISGSAVHSDLGSIGANEHHNQAHVLDGADHTVSGLTPGHVLQALSATTFGFALTPGIHDAVTIPVAANGLSLTGQEISLPTTASPTFTDLTLTGGDFTMNTVGASSIALLQTFRDSANGGSFNGYHYRGTQDIPTVVASGDRLFQLAGGGYSATAAAIILAAAVRFYVDAEPDTTGDTSDMPGRISFWTTPDGSGTLAERMRITSGGLLGLGTTAPDKQLEINSATGDCLRLTYNDSNGSAANYVDYAVTSGGDGTITPSGGDVNVVGTLSAGDGGTTDYSKFASNGDLSFVGSSGFYPRRVSQNTEPANGTGSTQIDVGELIIWNDANGGEYWLLYNDTAGGVRGIKLE
jgi:hypothetical protein